MIYTVPESTNESERITDPVSVRDTPLDVTWLAWG